MRVHWNIWLMAALGLFSIVVFLQLASLLRDLTRHDRAVDKDGVEYIIIDL